MCTGVAVEGDIFINHYHCKIGMILICTLAFMLCVFFYYEETFVSISNQYLLILIS